VFHRWRVAGVAGFLATVTVRSARKPPGGDLSARCARRAFAAHVPAFPAARSFHRSIFAGRDAPKRECVGTPRQSSPRGSAPAESPARIGDPLWLGLSTRPTRTRGVDSRGASPESFQRSGHLSGEASLSYDPHPCATGCGAVVFSSDERTCSLPCTMEMHRRKLEARQRRADRHTQLIGAMVLPIEPRPQADEPAKPARKTPKKRVRMPQERSKRKR
jgi:predicted nucleic acid-binding Zn ribbon protein